jgi:DNA-binding NtrC family response regulator
MLVRNVCTVVKGRCKIHMDKPTSKRLKIMIIEDEEDILTLYNDYLISRGHQVVIKSESGDSIMTEIERETPDVYLIDYRLLSNTNGIDVAIEILNKVPSAAIVFITAYEPLSREIPKHPMLYEKKIEVLLKPVKLNKIENSMLELVNKNTPSG